MAVGAGHEVGRYDTRRGERIGINDRQRRNRPAAKRFYKCSRALKQVRVLIKKVAWIRFTTRKTRFEERDLTEILCVHVEIVQNDEHILAFSLKMIGYQKSDGWCECNKGGGLVGERRDNNIFSFCTPQAALDPLE